MRLKFLPSFVKRRGRITKRQEKGLKLLNKYSISSVNDIKNESMKFKQCCLEIGFGNAEHLIHQAKENYETLFIGSEVYMSGIGSLLSYLDQNSISNVRVFPDDIRMLLDQDIIEIFDSIKILCPDPWPKDKHHKRRLINVGFLQMLNDFLKSNGSLYISTDWENYAESIKDTISRSEYFVSSNESYMNEKQLTKFEKRGIDQGRKIFGFNLKKKI